MDLQQIKYFLAVVDCGTFLAASKAVHVSQPTLSAGIRKLEESLGTPLFNRGSRAATLTSAGQEFLSPARQAYNQLLTAKSRLAEQPARIAIGLLNNIHMDCLARIVAEFRATHPQVLIEIQSTGKEELSRLLRERKVDLIVTNSLSHEGGFMPLIEEQLCIAASPRHPIAQQEIGDLSSLSGEAFIERVNCSFWTELDHRFREDGITPQTVFQAESDEFVLSLVAANLGVSVITRRTTPYDVRFIPIRDFSINRSIGVCVREGPRTEQLQAMCDTLFGKSKAHMKKASR